jgi:hypothetical protein
VGRKTSLIVIGDRPIAFGTMSIYGKVHGTGAGAGFGADSPDSQGAASSEGFSGVARRIDPNPGAVRNRSDGDCFARFAQFPAPAEKGRQGASNLGRHAAAHELVASAVFAMWWALAHQIQSIRAMRKQSQFPKR